MAARKNKKRTRRGPAAKAKPVSSAAAREAASETSHAATPGAQPPTSKPARAFSHSIPNALAVPDALAALTLALLIAVCFFPVTGAGFVWDDLAFTSAAPVQNWGGLWQIWLTPGDIDKEGHYWPVLYTTFWLEHKLWGFNPLGYHLVNLLFHAGVTLLLWRLLRRLEVPGAWLAAAVFAVHPLHTESVAWVIGRKDLLATGFFVAAALCYIRFVEDRSERHYAGALALFMLSLLSKSLAVTLPASLLLWHWWRRGRVSIADLGRALPFLLLGLGVTVADYLAYKDLEKISFDYSLIERALIAAQALGFYAGKLVWPAGLAVIHPKWEVGANPLAWGYLTAIVAVPAALWFFRRRIGRGPLAGVLFFAVTLSPTLGFVDYGYMQFSFVADRYQYLAGAGVIAALVAAATCGVNALRGAWKTGVSALAVVPLLLLGMLTWQQAGIYRSEETFFKHITTLNPRARLAYYNLGREYMRQERFEEALAAFRNEYRFALQQQPLDRKRLSQANLGIGIVAENQGRLEEAEAHYQSAIRSSEAAFHRLTTLLARQQRYTDALELYETFIQTNPRNAKLHSDMGVTLFKLNRAEEALQSFDRALALDPNLQEALSNRESVRQFLEDKGGG